MANLKNTICVLVLSSALGISAANKAAAHPHEFVQMKVSLNFTDGSTVTGMRYTWLFDEFFSAYAVGPADEDGDGKPEQAGLDKLIREILGNIKPIDYFTKFDTQEFVPKLAAANPVSSTMIGRQLQIVFDVPFQKPVSAKENPFSFSIYDDEFYIAMNVSTDDDAITFQSAASGCSYDLTLPDPSDDVKAFASSLDKTQSGGPDLGLNFAEWVSVRCK